MTLALSRLVRAPHAAPRWPWVLSLLGALLLWVPAVGLFAVVPHLWPQVRDGASPAYYHLMAMQVVWIILVLPVALLGALLATATGLHPHDVPTVTGTVPAGRAQEGQA